MVTKEEQNIFEEMDLINLSTPDLNSFLLSQDITSFNMYGPTDITSPSVTIEMEENSTDTVMKLEMSDIISSSTKFAPTIKLGPPTRGNMQGPFNFNVSIDSINIHKKKYVYSNDLNRIYVAMECNFPVQYSWNVTDSHTPMYVRATIVFSDTSQYEKRVERCIQHKHMKKDNQDVVGDVSNHVLRSARELGTEGVYYCGDAARSDSWFSVLVGFPDAAAAVTHAYVFVCKNSCSSGINRRGTEIIFTLEDAWGTVHGRQTVGVRVCACPRRDMLKDEKEVQGTGACKRRLQEPQPHDDHPPPAKKVQVEVQPAGDGSPRLLTMSLTMSDKAARTALPVCIAIMEEGMHKVKQKELEAYRKAIHALKEQLEGVTQ